MVHEGPVTHSLSLDDSPHQLFLVHGCTDDFQVASVDDDLAKIYNWGSLQKDLISVLPLQTMSIPELPVEHLFYLVTCSSRDLTTSTTQGTEQNGVE